MALVLYQKLLIFHIPIFLILGMNSPISGPSSCSRCNLPYPDGLRHAQVSKSVDDGGMNPQPSLASLATRPAFSFLISYVSVLPKTNHERICYGNQWRYRADIYSWR